MTQRRGQRWREGTRPAPLTERLCFLHDIQRRSRREEPGERAEGHCGPDSAVCLEEEQQQQQQRRRRTS